MSRLRRNLANAALFQLGWLACVFGARQPPLLALAVLCLALHLRWLAQPGEWRALLVIGLFGSTLDSLLLQLGLFDFPGDSPLLPAWLALLWLLLASTLGHCLAWSARPLWRSVLCGALGGPLAYLAGARLAGVGLPLGSGTTLILLAAVWAGVLPLCQRLHARFCP